MHVRPAGYGDVLDVAHILHEHTRRKAHIETCRSRASAAVKRGLRPGAFALVCCDDNSEARGFLFAQKIEYLELMPQSFHYHVVYLAGRHCAVQLLRDLRKRTGSRILFQAHDKWGNMEAYRRLIRRAVPNACDFGHIFEL